MLLRRLEETKQFFGPFPVQVAVSFKSIYLGEAKICSRIVTNRTHHVHQTGRD